MCHPQAPATKAILATIEKARAKRPQTRERHRRCHTERLSRGRFLPHASSPLARLPAQGGDVALRKMRQERGEKLAREYHTTTMAENKRREHEAAEAAAAAIAAKAAAEEHEAKIQEELDSLRTRVEDLQAEVDRFRAEKEAIEKKEAEEAAAKAAAADAKGGKGKGKKK